MHWFPVEQAESDFQLAGAPDINELKFFERLSQNERVMRLLEKIKTLVEEEDKKYEPINKHKLDTRATAIRTRSGRSKTFKKRDGKTRKGQFLETQQRKKERIIRGRKCC